MRTLRVQNHSANALVFGYLGWQRNLVFLRSVEVRASQLLQTGRSWMLITRQLRLGLTETEREACVFPVSAAQQLGPLR